MSFSNIKLFWFYCFFHRNQSRSRHSFLEWAIDGDVSTVEEILHARMPVDCADVLDPMALIKAGQFNRTDVIRLLLQRGADVLNQIISVIHLSIWQQFRTQLTLLHCCSSMEHRSTSPKIEVKNQLTSHFVTTWKQQFVCWNNYK